jgi:hypothetical protein
MRAAIGDAARHGHQDAVDLLIENGGNVEDAMRYAITKGQVHLAEHLLKKHPDLVAAGRIGIKELQTAAFILNPAIIALLLNKKIHITKEDTEDEDSLTIDAARERPWGWMIDEITKRKVAEDSLVKSMALAELFLEKATKQLTTSDGKVHEDARTWVGGVWASRRTWQWVGKY